jgi:hypothetical protein
MRDQTAVVGVGATPYYKRGQSLPETQLSMACTAILGALDDAGLTVADLDGFAIYSNSVDPAQVASVLGVPEVRFATLTSGGGGSVRHPLSPALGAVVPYVAAVIDLAGTQGAGARLLANVIDCDPEAVAVGDQVRVIFDRLSDTLALPRVTPFRKA